MSTVYRAEEVYSGHHVALKVLKREQVDPSYRERFLREAKSQAALSNPNIARIFHFGRDLDLGVLYIAMEYVAGDTLGRLLDEGRLPLNLAVQIGLQICNGLAAAHEAGIIHRDLKPANIMLRPRDGKLRVKLLDFGFAKPLETDNDLTAQGKIAGTLTYITPEQIRQDELTHHVDIYTLGLVLYEMMTGRPLFQGRAPQETAIMHLRDPAPHISDYVPDANMPLDFLVNSMVQKDPDDRPESIEEVSEALKEIWDDEELEVFHPSHTGPSQDVFKDWHVIAQG